MPESVSDLIPFYLNGTLSPEESQRVEAALLEDEAVREEFFRWLEVKNHLEATGRGRATADASGDPARFRSKLKRRTTLYIPLQRASARYLRIPSWAWQPAVVLIVALQLVALGLFVAGVSVDKRGRYQVMSAPQTQTAAGQAYNVIFQPEATEQQIRTLLLAYRAQFVEGPNRVGLYRIRFGFFSQEKLDQFQNEPIVRFMERNL